MGRPSKMNIKLIGPVVIALAVILVVLLNRETSGIKTNLVASKSHCPGVAYSGAWFEVIVPENFIAKPSLPSTTNDGYDSVWFVNSTLGMALYVYSPQWGGKPSDIIDDSAVAHLREHVQSNEESSVHTRAVAYNDGQSGSFTSTEKIDYASHLTTGYRSKQSPLSEELEQIYTCFVQSIQQFAD